MANPNPNPNPNPVPVPMRLVPVKLFVRNPEEEEYWHLKHLGMVEVGEDVERFEKRLLDFMQTKSQLLSEYFGNEDRKELVSVTYGAPGAVGFTPMASIASDFEKFQDFTNILSHFRLYRLSPPEFFPHNLQYFVPGGANDGGDGENEEGENGGGD